MANRVMYRKDAEKFLHENGWKLFLDKIINENIIVMGEPPIEVVCQTSGYYMDYGKIRVEHWPEGLVLWIGGKIVWKSFE